MFKQTFRLVLAVLIICKLNLQAQHLSESSFAANVTVPKQNETNAGYNLFQEIKGTDISAARFAQNAQFFKLDKSQLSQLILEKPASVTLSLPFHGTTLYLDLTQVALTSERFQVVNPAGNAITPLDYIPGLHYQGTLNGHDNSFVAFSFFEGEVLGIISNQPWNNLILGRIQIPGNTSEYMLYSDLDLAMDNPFECSVSELVSQFSYQAKTPTVHGSKTREIKVALEADFALVRKCGGIHPTADYLVALFNQMAGVLNKEGVKLLLTQISIPDAPQYLTEGTASDMLLEYSRHQDRTVADIFQMVTISDVNHESVSRTKGLCASSISSACIAIEPEFLHVPTFSWAATGMLHQLGHQLGSRHTQWCGWPGGAIESCSNGLEGTCLQTGIESETKTLMSYCLMDGTPASLAAGFGQLPGDLIRNNVWASPCLETFDRQDFKTDKSNTFSNETALVPNPTQGELQVMLPKSTNHHLTKIAVLDLLGRIMLTEKIQNQVESVQLNVSNFPTGVYLVQLYEGDSLVTSQRLVKE